ncbi:MAG: putative acyl-CoA thioester hydrolase [Acidobacteria bacterium]|jgi:acyl-CoA hydrolase|nr:putative acyl-CoA thioester hydrolase [Acidobacteriota bacterium]
MELTPKRAADSATEMVQVVLPNDANPLGFILGGTVMHLIDIAGAIACHRHTRTLLVTAAVDDLQFLNSIKVGDLIILKSRVTCVFTTSLEVRVDVFSEETLTGTRQMTSTAFLTFVAIDRSGNKVRIPPLLVESAEERRICDDAHARRAARLRRKSMANG